jgi:5-methyltetrahydropteroyltriglutamate--homocysteine methyltransferase
MSGLPLFPVTTVGSWPRPPAVIEAQRALRRQRIRQNEFDAVADDAVRDCIRLQEDAGCDLITDGELRRDNFYSFVAQKCDGICLMTLAEMLDVVEDKAGFELLLQTLDVPAYAISRSASESHPTGSLSPDARDVRRGRDETLLCDQRRSR